MEAVGANMTSRPRTIRTTKTTHGNGSQEGEGSTAAGRLLRRMGLRPRKGLGQHFLVSQGVLARIVAAADIGPKDTVVEIGPGLGALTELLARRAGRVVALELDDELAIALKNVFADQPHVEILHGDAMGTNINGLVPESKQYK
ncbi:uncharacterized protein METZ01_LOCUS355981, partial [marine metagenome]